MVQGVGFRWWTRRTANELQIVGWVRNLFDGRVEIWLEGDAAAVSDMIQRCQDGPRSADVTGVDARVQTPAGLSGFTIAADSSSASADALRSD